MAIDDQTSFPRGGGSQPSADSSKLKSKKKFVTSSSKFPADESTNKRKKWDSDEEQGSDDEMQHQEVETATQETKKSRKQKHVDATKGLWLERLDAKLAGSGLVMMGCVTQVNESYIDLELVDNVHARLHSNAISTHCPESGVRLGQYFAVGQMCVVTADQKQTHDKRNCYLVDLGFDSVKGFLPIESCNGRVLHAGQTLLCTITKLVSHNRVAHLQPTVEYDPSTESLASLQRQHLMPGMSFAAGVESVVNNGVLVNINQYVRAFVHRNKLPVKYQFDIDKLSQDSATMCLPITVTYVRVNSNVLGISALPHLLKPTQIQAKHPYTIGQTLTATVVLRTPSDHVYLAPSTSTIDDDATDESPKKKTKKSKKSSVTSENAEPLYLLVRRRELDVDKDTASATIAEKYAKGSAHRCKIVNLNVMDHVAYGSCNATVLAQTLVSARQAQPGAKVSCTVVATSKSGVYLMINGRINAFLPLIHTADRPVHPNKLDQTFAKDQQLSCRVLYYDAGHDSVIVTHKKSLVKSSLPHVTSYSPELVKRQTMAVVVAPPVNHGALVVMYNQVKAWCLFDKSHQPTVGEPITIEVVAVNEAEHRMKAKSVQKQGNDEESLDAKENQSANTKDDTTSVIDENHVQLNLKRIGQVKLATSHLTDSLVPETAAVYQRHYQQHGSPAYVSLGHNGKGRVTVCCKPLVISWCHARQQAMRFAELEVGKLVAGVVESVHPEFGLFVTLPTADGEAPLKALAPYGHVDGGKQSQCRVGQTVIAKIDKIDLQQRRITIMMKKRFCYPPGVPVESLGLDLLFEWVMWRQRASQMVTVKKVTCSALDESQCPRVGELVNVSISRLQDNLGALVQLEDTQYSGLNGVVIKAHFDVNKEYEVGQSCTGMVLSVDYPSMAIEISFWPELTRLDSLTTAKTQMADAKMKPEGLVKALVISNKPDYSLVAVRPAPGLGYCRQYLALIPSRLHPNQPANELGRYELGKDLSIILRRRCNKSDVTGIICDEAQLWTCNAEADVSQMHTFVVQNTKSGDVKPTLLVLDRKRKKYAVGDMARATVTGEVINGAHRSSYIQIKLDNSANGCLHVSELPVKFLHKHLRSPIQQFIEQMRDKELMIRVITKTGKHAPGVSNNRQLNQQLLHCTANEAKLRAKSAKKKAIGYQEKFGCHETLDAVLVSQVDADHIRVDVNANWSGVISRLHVSGDLDVVNDVVSNFRVGQLLRNVCVMGTDRTHRSLNLSLLPRLTQCVSLDVPCLGLITVIHPLKDHKSDLANLVRLTLPNGGQGIIGACELVDDYPLLAEAMKTLKTGVCIRVLPLKSLPANKWIVTPRRDLIEELTTTARPSSTTATERRRTRSNSGCVDVTGQRNRLVGDVSELTVDDELYAFVNDVQSVYINRDLIGKVSAHSTALKGLKKGHVVQVKVLEIHGTKSANEDDEMLECAVAVEVLDTNVQPSTSQPIVTESPNKKKQIRRPDLTPPEIKDPAALPRFESVVNSRKDEQLGDVIASAIDQPSAKKSKQLSDMLDDKFDWEPAEFAPSKFVDVTLSSGSAEPVALNASVDESITLSNEPTKATTSLNASAIKEFDKLLMDSPNSADLWLKYMNMFSDAGDIARARQTAKRALDVIGYREEPERLRVWIGWYALEVNLGVESDRDAVLKEARKNCDELKVCQKAVGVLQAAAKHQACDDLLLDMQKRFKTDAAVDVWVLSGQHYLRSDRAQLSHHTMQKAVASLPKTQHVNVLHRFAQLELREGDTERGKTLFESLLSSYPKRTDIWLVYVDLLLKRAGVEQARQVLDRVTNLPLGAHRMRTFYKKWLDVEHKHGDESSQAEVKQRAAGYVERLQKTLGLSETAGNDDVEM